MRVTLNPYWEQHHEESPPQARQAQQETSPLAHVSPALRRGSS